jgi:N-acetyl-beta-hexosaminidase
MRNDNEVECKHIDVVTETDTRPVHSGGSIEHGYRFLVQYATGRRVEFIPTLDLPAAPTLEALIALYPDSSSQEMMDAVLRASNEPHKRPEYKGS